MPKKLVQKLYLRELPPGLNVTITNVEPSIRGDEEWEVEFACEGGGSVSINCNTGPYKSYNDLSDRYPIRLATSTNQGLIGVVKFGGYSALYSSGPGGKVDITIRIQGTVNDNGNGNSYNIDRTGYISVTATRWTGLERPDYIIISYDWDNTPPDILLNKVPGTFFTQPADACFSFGVSVDGNQISVETTLHKGILARLMDSLIEWIFQNVWKVVSLVIEPLTGCLGKWFRSFVKNFLVYLSDLRGKMANFVNRTVFIFQTVI